MAVVGGYVQDALTRIVNVRWGGVDQQGLVAEYPTAGTPPFENISEVMKGTPTAYALESGQSFAGVNMGASGLGHTVLTPGLVCFGKPRDGNACFVAAPGFKYIGESNDALQRGVLNEEGKDLVWGGAAGGGGGSGMLRALSFAGDAFFAVYSSETAINIATSHDGIKWTINEAGFGGDTLGGAVAAIKSEDVDIDGRPKYLYVFGAETYQDDPANEWANFVANLAWSSSEDGTAWSPGSNAGFMAGPATQYGTINNFACTIAGGEVKKQQTLVAAAATKTLIIDHGFQYVMPTAGPAVSETGTNWNVHAVGTPASLDAISWGLAVTFVKEKGGEGYFLMSDHEIFGGEDPPIPKSHLYKSTDGASWSTIRTNGNWMSTLSAVAKDLDATTIVNI